MTIPSVTKIPVIFAFDLNYLLPATISIESLLSHKEKSTYYEIFCLVPKIEPPYNYALEQLRLRYHHFSIELIEMKNILSEKTLANPQIPCVKYYYFKAAEVLDQYDKAIYLDTDTIIKNDLTFFFETPLRNKLFAAVRDPGMIGWNSVKNYPINMGEYFNAGVLLMNLVKIRTEKRSEKWISLIGKNFPFFDQDILNITSVNEVIFFPLQYNLTTLFLQYEELLIKAFGVIEILESLKNPHIIHYCGLHKPWLFLNQPYQQEWDRYFEKSIFSHFPLPRSKNCI